MSKLAQFSGMNSIFL